MSLNYYICLHLHLGKFSVTQNVVTIRIVGKTLIRFPTLFLPNQQVGDIIVDNLVQSRDLDKVLRSAKLGGIKERRNAAFEMVSLVASNTETKMAVVNEGG